MIVLALLAAAEAAFPPPPATEEEIVVVAQKMRLIEVDLKAPKRRGVLVLQACRVTRPSGYTQLDAIPCEAAQQCIRDRPTNRKALEGCVEARSQTRLDAVVAAWRAAWKVPE